MAIFFYKEMLQNPIASYMFPVVQQTNSRSIPCIQRLSSPLPHDFIQPSPSHSSSYSTQFFPSLSHTSDSLINSPQIATDVTTTSQRLNHELTLVQFLLLLSSNLRSSAVDVCIICDEQVWRVRRALEQQRNGTVRPRGGGST